MPTAQVQLSQLNNEILAIQLDGVPAVLLQCVPSGQSLIGWNGQAPTQLTILPAGHTPGIYHVSAPLIVRATGGGGVATRTIDFSAPILGPTTHTNAADVNVGNVGLAGAEVVPIVSDGVSPVVVKLTPGGVDPASLIDFYAGAELVVSPP